MNVRHLSFRLLQVYVQVVRSGSVSAAARALHLTQPTVSLQLKNLREAINEPLFDVNNGKMRVTHVGDELYRAACDVLSRFDDFNDFLQDARLGQSGHINIGIVTTAKYILPRILGAFYRQFPKISVTIHIGNRARIIERLGQQEDDLYLFSHPPSGNHVNSCRILKNPLQMIAPQGHWAARKKHLTFQDLSEERFLIREPGSATRMIFEAWLSSHGFELGNTMQIESNEAICLSVASGLGLSVISEHTLLEGREKLAILPLNDFPLLSNWYLVNRRDRRASYATEQLVRFIAHDLKNCINPAWVAEDIEPALNDFLHKSGVGEKT